MNFKYIFNVVYITISTIVICTYTAFLIVPFIYLKRLFAYPLNRIARRIKGQDLSDIELERIGSFESIIPIIVNVVRNLNRR